MAREKVDRELERITNENRHHIGEWLTEEDVKYYLEKAKSIPGTNGQDVRMKRELREELQNRFGLLEIEAINILNGFHIASYLKKYERIRTLTKLNADTNKDTKDSED